LIFIHFPLTEIGTHKDLVDLKGLYYGIYEKQLIEEKIQEEEA
jgi:hypothetical protein